MKASTDFFLFHDVNFGCAVGIFLKILDFIDLIVKVLLIVTTGLDDACHKSDSFHQYDFN